MAVYFYMHVYVYIHMYIYIHTHLLFIYLQVNLLKFHFAVNRNIPFLSHPTDYRSYPAKSDQCLVSENNKHLEVKL